MPTKAPHMCSFSATTYGRNVRQLGAICVKKRKVVFLKRCTFCPQYYQSLIDGRPHLTFRRFVSYAAHRGHGTLSTRAAGSPPDTYGLCPPVLPRETVCPFPLPPPTPLRHHPAHLVCGGARVAFSLQLSPVCGQGLAGCMRVINLVTWKR